MKYLVLVAKHLRQTWVRTASTAAAVGLCVFLFCSLRSVLAEVDSYVETRSPRRLITSSLMGGGLPLAHGPRIQRVPGVRRVAAGLLFAGFLRAKREERGSSVAQWTTFFHNMAVDAEPYFAMNPEMRIPPAQYRDFLADPGGCVVGRKLAEKLGWSLGDRFFLESIVPGFQKASGPFEFAVRGFIDPDLENHPGTPTDVMFFHLRYLDVLPTVKGWTVNFMVEVEDPARAAEVANSIDARFENSSEQTVTGTEKAFAADFASSIGELSGLLNGIGIAVCFTILLVTANTMSMAVRERRTEIAVLKTIGFRSAQVMALVVLESALLAALGGALGIAVAFAALWVLNAMPGVILPGLATVALRPTVILLSLAMALSIGVAAGLLPAWTAYRARVTEMLRAI
jgi:putative ABC transport system permease protein